MNELSIRAARDAAPHRVAVIAAGRSFTFAELAKSASSAGPAPRIVARADIDTAVAVYARLDRRVPSVLVHPRLTGAELAALPKPGDDLVTVFTSGSAGTARPVGLSADMLVASARASAANLGWLPDDRWLCVLPLAHVGGLSILTRCLIARRCAVLDAEPFDPHRIAEVIDRDLVTLVSFVPTMLARLVDTGWAPPAHLRAALIGGASPSVALLERAVALRIPVLSTYGMTETCSQVCTQPLAEAGTVSADAGPALSGVELRIDDGEILVRGPMVAARGWLRTGDRGRLDERGRLHVFGRADDTIITGGENVDPDEVENALGRDPAVAGACVFGVPDPEWGRPQAPAPHVRNRCAAPRGHRQSRPRRRQANHRRPPGSCRRSLAVLPSPRG